METVEEIKRKSKKKESRFGRRYGVEFKLRCVKLRLEEGIPLSLLTKEVGASKEVIRRWTRTYQEQGEAGLRNPKTPRVNRRKLAGPVREKIVEIKKRFPLFGVKRISQLLKRVFFLSASPETVRRTLRGQSLIVPTKKKSQHNLTRPRFFERSTPNQMWQSDIFTFRLGGRYAYLIGFIDDYSRYVVGLGLYRSQTADQVLEVYRRAVGEYGVAKEVLTDRGRQYTNWRGTTRFERELVKDRVKHIKSQAHHPMTLGKIERFWKTIYEEFLIRAQFVSFEEAQDRIRQWVQYYNHKRPHQGIGGLCPADRFFEIQAELKKTIEQGIAENVLEIALRGKPKEPFYMVGRMEGQSVVLRAEKGKLRLMVDDEEGGAKQEMVYDVTVQEGQDHPDRSLETIQKEEKNGKDREAEGGETRGGGQKGTESFGTYGGGEMPGGVVGLDGETQTRGDLPGTGGGLDDPEPVAVAGHGGDASSPSAPDPGGKRGSFESSTCGIVGAEEQSRIDQEAGSALGPTAGDSGSQNRRVTGDCRREEAVSLFREFGNGAEATKAQEKGAEPGACASEGSGDPSGKKRSLDGQGGSRAPGDLSEDLLRLGGALPQSDGPGPGEPPGRETGCGGRRGEGGPTGKGPGVGEEPLAGREDHRGQRDPDGLWGVSGSGE
jgi:transposase InsO family protein